MDLETFQLETNTANDEFTLKVAQEELRETPANIQYGLKTLRKLLDEIDQENPQATRFPKHNELWLLNFLRICKFYPESAKDRILQYYSLREKHSSVFKDLSFENLRETVQAGNFIVLKCRDQLRRRVIIQQIDKWDHKRIDKFEMIRAFDVLVDIFRLEPETQIHGAVYILDLKGLTMSQTLQFTPYFVKVLLEVLQRMVPLRLKGYHIINNPGIFLPIFKLVKKFLNEKYSQRTHMHGFNLESLHRFIEPSCLPESYGGTLPAPWGCSKHFFKVAQMHQQQYDLLH